MAAYELHDDLQRDSLFGWVPRPSPLAPHPFKSPMPDFVRVAKVAELPDPGKMLVEVDDRLVVLFRVGGKYYALDDVCTHDGGPLSEGALDAKGCTIACPRHGAKFDIRNGAALTMPATQATVAHEVKVEGDDILVRLSD
jgi:3-phenylpropionate/trans-cinnamate dioxygenase ferredoxin component